MQTASRSSGPVADKDILAHLDRHAQAVMKDFYRTSEFCAACHKAALPKQLNHYKWQRAFAVYDEWQQASFSKQSPLPFYVKDKVSKCQDCHMESEPITMRDFGSEPGKIATHRWVGANTLMSKYYGYDQQLEKTIAFLRNKVLNVDIFGIERNGHAIIAPLGNASLHRRAGRRAYRIGGRFRTRALAHTLVPEQRDFYESWVEFEAKDATGRVLMHSGGLAPDGTLDPSAHSFTNRLISVDNKLNDLHQVWDTRIQAYNNTINSGRSQVVRYRVQCTQERYRTHQHDGESELPALQSEVHQLCIWQALRHAGGGDGLAHANAGAWRKRDCAAR